MKDKTDAELIEEAEKLDFSDILPFEIAVGDTLKRLTPHNGLNLNSTGAWLVSQESRSRHKMQTKPVEIEQALALIIELASRLRSANGRLDAANDVKAAQKIVLEHLEKELKSANALLDERLKQVTVMHGELREAKEKGQLALQACEFLGVPLNVGLLSKRPLTEMEKQGALKYERKARELMAPSPAFCTCVGPTVANTASMCGRCGKRRFAAPTITSTSNPDDGGK